MSSEHTHYGSCVLEHTLWIVCAENIRVDIEPMSPYGEIELLIPLSLLLPHNSMEIRG